MKRAAPLLIVLALQACLLFSALDLLPVWSDELFTIHTVAHPVNEIVPIVQHDIHPPLYYLLLHFWGKWMPAAGGVSALRAFSALWALLATLLLDLFFTRRLMPLERCAALTLFAFSPCLLLYARMARSYSMQTALVLLAVGLMALWMRSPRSLRLACGALLGILLVLYTHYAPGLALLAGFILSGWRRVGWVRTAGFALAALLGYAPWASGLSSAFDRWTASSGFSSQYAVTGSLGLEHIVKVGFGLVSLTIGETFLGLSLLLVPVVLILAWQGARKPVIARPWASILAVAAPVGYLGVARWVSYPFIPARLLWLLPFLCLLVADGVGRIERVFAQRLLIGALLLAYVSSEVLYFRKENFLNHGYAVPLPEIAATLNRAALPADLILLDPYNTDFQSLAAQLSGRSPYLVLDGIGAAGAQDRAASAKTIWIVRNTRDASPGRTTGRVQSAVCAGRPATTSLFEPYPPWQQFAMSLVGLRPPLTHFYQLTACGPAASNRSGN